MIMTSIWFKWNVSGDSTLKYIIANEMLAVTLDYDM